jgi:hypothetical protein
MYAPVAAVLDVVRTHSDPRTAWARIVDLCRASAPHAPWQALPTPDIERDIRMASRWIRGELGGETEPCGVYLGLDTLNMERGSGSNLEIALGAGTPEDASAGQWLFEGPKTYGSSHLIRGLYELHRVYRKRTWKPWFDLCDYTLFLGYSGLVLAQVFDCVRDLGPLVVIWGFHDGDLFVLGRHRDGAFVRSTAPIELAD